MDSKTNQFVGAVFESASGFSESERTNSHGAIQIDDLDWENSNDGYVNVEKGFRWYVEDLAETAPLNEYGEDANPNFDEFPSVGDLIPCVNSHGQPDERVADEDDIRQMLWDWPGGPLYNYRLRPTEFIELCSLPSGEVDLEVRGNPRGRAKLCAEQGNNELGWSQDCALAAIAAMLTGIDYQVYKNENEIVGEAHRQSPWNDQNCEAAKKGGCTIGQIAALLDEFCYQSLSMDGQSPAQISEAIDQGLGVIIGIRILSKNEHSLAEPPNHAVWATATARESEGKLVGIFFNDTGDGQAYFMGIDLLNNIFTNCGGYAVFAKPSNPA